MNLQGIDERLNLSKNEQDDLADVGKLATRFKVNLKHFLILNNYYVCLKGVSMQKNNLVVTETDLMVTLRSYRLKMPFKKDFLASIQSPAVE